MTRVRRGCFAAEFPSATAGGSSCTASTPLKQRQLQYIAVFLANLLANLRDDASSEVTDYRPDQLALEILYSVSFVHDEKFPTQVHHEPTST